MQNTEPQGKVCFRCAKFRGYYTKGLSSFKRVKQGYCLTHQKITENMDACEHWCSKGGNFTSKKTSMEVLSDLLTQISGIRQILQEDQEEDEAIQ